MDKFSEYANSLLAELKKCHEEADSNKPNIDHFLKKLIDGRESLTEHERCECVRMFQKLRSTLIEMSPSLSTLTKLIDDGLKLLERLEENPRSLKNLKPAAYETDDSSLGAQLRKGNRRGIKPDSGLGSERGSSIYSNVPSGTDFDVNARPPSSPMEHEDENVSINDLNLPRCEDRLHNIPCPNLSPGSLESNSCNEDTMQDNEGVEVRYDRKIWAVPVVPPERDSAAFAHAIPEADVSSINAQATAALKQRPRNRNDGSVIVMKDEKNDDNECDV